MMLIVTGTMAHVALIGLSQHKWSGHKWSGGPFMFNINGPPGPLMLSQMVPLDNLCQNINGPGPYM